MVLNIVLGSVNVIIGLQYLDLYLSTIITVFQI